MDQLTDIGNVYVFRWAVFITGFEVNSFQFGLKSGFGLDSWKGSLPTPVWLLSACSLGRSDHSVSKEINSSNTSVVTLLFVQIKEFSTGIFNK